MVTSRRGGALPLRPTPQITLALSSGATSQVRGMVQNTSLYADVAACDLLSKTPRADTLRNAGSAAVANGEACSTGPRGRVPVQTALERLVLGDMDGWQHARAEQDWQRSLVLKSVMEDMAPCESTEATYEALDSVVRQAVRACGARGEGAHMRRVHADQLLGLML